MNLRELKNVPEILDTSGYMLFSADKEDTGVIKFYSPDIKDRNGVEFFFYYCVNKVDGKTYLGDGGFLLETLQKSGLDIQLKLLQDMLKTYGLIFTEQYLVLEGNNDLPWRIRVNNFLLGFLAVDAILRSWIRE